MLYSELIAKKKKKKSCFIEFSCVCLDYVIFSFFLLLGYCLQVFEAYTLFYSAKLLSFPLLAFKMNIALVLGFYCKYLQESCSIPWLCRSEKRKGLCKIEISRGRISKN